MLVSQTARIESAFTVGDLEGAYESARLSSMPIRCQKGGDHGRVDHVELRP
jgi:hypothetical protein